jgi:alpha-galactosidase
MRRNSTKILILIALAACALPGAHGASAVNVAVNPAGAIRVKTPVAVFELRRSGYLAGHLTMNGQELTLDDPAQDEAGGDLLVSGGAPARFDPLDFHRAKISDIRGGIGSRGKRIEVTAKQGGAGGLEKVLALEVYDDFPKAAFLTVTYRNAGKAAVKLDQISFQRHRLNAALTNAQASPFQMWSFQGSSFKWGHDDVSLLTKDFSQPNLVGVATPSGMGGGIPVVAFWTRAAGTAIGHVEPRAETLSLPVEVGDDGRVAASVRIDAGVSLKPGESYATPRSFLAVFSGDYYEPLSMWSAILQRQSWMPAQPPSDAFEANWCGWGYLGSVTPAQMVDTIPKLKEFGIKWATLDAGWYNASGDWEPNAGTFAGDAVRRMVDEFHKNGIRISVWWAPIEAADGQGGRRGGRGTPSKVAREHPEWVIQDASGKRAGLRNNSLAALCPALPEVQSYYRRVTERLIRDYDFDGSKMDYIFSVPRCYNPAHHHKSPDDSVRAVADVYKIIQETSKALKPYSVTQICPCGTTPNLAWLPFENQAVTGDPVGSIQVRRRIKLYKALLGPRSAVYGDHVELSKIRFDPNREVDLGEDFASTVGTGGVLGTKFTWPDYGDRFDDVFLTPRKEAIWKQWIPIYNSMMLSKGTFLNLYTVGYDSPEGYAIAKDGKMYYAFFVGEAQPWEGALELRGLEKGRYRVFDYVNRKELGSVDESNPRLQTQFTEHLLLEVSRQ